MKSEETKHTIQNIYTCVTDMAAQQANCMEGYKKNKETMENVLTSLDNHLGNFGKNLDKFGDNLDRLTDRLDRIFSGGMIPVPTLNKIVVALIAMAGAFLFITIILLIGVEGINKLSGNPLISQNVPSIQAVD